MKTNDNYEIRTYGKSELAMLYFPNALTTAGAMNNLNSWIRGCRPLHEAIRGCGMPPKSKFFTPREVALLFEYLGEPL